MAHNIRVHYGMTNVSWADFVASGLFTVKRGGFARNQEAQIDVFRDLDTNWSLLNGLESHFVLPDIYGLEALYDRHKKGDILRKYTDGTAEQALIKSRGLNATEAKDKAYSMLWAFPESSNATDPLRRADYNKPIDEIYTEYTTAIFIKMKGAPMQFYMVNSASRNLNLPSWVPDWEKRTSMSYFLWTRQLMGFQAANEDSRKYKLEIDGRILRVSGVEHSKMKALVRLSEEVHQRNLIEASPEELVEGLIDTVEVIRSVIQGDPFFAVIVALSPYIDIYRLLHVGLLDHRDKDFSITDKGNMGVAFQGLKSNDVVAIWMGCPSPVIVRKIEIDGRDIYQLHGPAYVDNIMNGEAWTENKDDWRVFELI